MEEKELQPEEYYLFVLTILNTIKIGFVEPIFWYKMTKNIFSWLFSLYYYKRETKQFIQMTMLGFNIAIKTRTK